MTDTAQPVAAENVDAQIDNAADAFKSFLNPGPAQPRDDAGRFASAEEPEAAEEEEALVSGEEDEGHEPEEAAEEAQPEGAELPSSWSKEDAEIWESLPPEAQARIAEREAQRDAGLNSKLQESANARKEAERHAAEANANRDKYAAAIDEVLSLVQLEKPNPVQYGLGTEHYDREAYDYAVYQFEQANSTVEVLRQQRQEIAAQQAQEAERARIAAHQEIEQTAWPKFLADVPDLADPSKGRKIVADIIDYAKSAGIPGNVFDDPEIAKTLTSAELHLAWKAREYDRIKAAEQRVKATNPPPKPKGPVVKPGGVTPRQTIQANRLTKAKDRLTREGSVEAGAAVFKHFL